LVNVLNEGLGPFESDREPNEVLCDSHPESLLFRQPGVTRPCPSSERERRLDVKEVVGVLRLDWAYGMMAMLTSVPSEPANRIRRVESRNFVALANPPRTKNEMTPEQPDCCFRAKAWSGCDGSP
jgi:hypothetical protein